MKNLLFRPQTILLLIHILLSIILYHTYGVKIVNDSHRYMEYADNLNSGMYFDKHNFWYFGYTFFIFLINKIHNSTLAIVIAQIILSGIGVLFLYKASLLIYKNSKNAIITSLCYLFFIEILTWNNYILCESVYCSCICICMYLCVKTFYNSQNIRVLIPALIAILFTSLIKPTGIALISSFVILIFYKYHFMIKIKIIRYTTMCTMLVVLILLINKMLTTFLIIENYQLGEIVYGISTLGEKPAYQLLKITVPNNLYIPSDDNQPFIKILSFIIYNPIYWSKLFFSKVFFLLMHIRPYWSIHHNVFSLLVLLPMYLYLLRGIFLIKHINKDILLFFILYLSIHILSIGITSVDWDGRFLMPLLPVIFTMASGGMLRDYKKYVLPKFSNFMKYKGETFSN